MRKQAAGSGEDWEPDPKVLLGAGYVTLSFRGETMRLTPLNAKVLGEALQRTAEELLAAHQAETTSEG